MTDQDIENTFRICSKEHPSAYQTHAALIRQIDSARDKPTCPYCKTQLFQMRFKGYYEEFDFWGCNCDLLPEAEKNVYKGSYA
jgi:hypothetical protein